MYLFSFSRLWYVFVKEYSRSSLHSSGSYVPDKPLTQKTHFIHATICSVSWCLCVYGITESTKRTPWRCTPIPYLLLRWCTQTRHGQELPGGNMNFTQFWGNIPHNLCYPDRGLNNMAAMWQTSYSETSLTENKDTDIVQTSFSERFLKENRCCHSFWWCWHCVTQHNTMDYVLDL